MYKNSVLSELRPKLLILITSGFPFGNGEPFLETEINYLAKSFDELIILSQSTTDKGRRAVPDNCTVIRYPVKVGKRDKLRSLLGIFNPLIRSEKRHIANKYGKKLVPGMVKTMLISLHKGQIIANKCADILKDKKNFDCYFYSYWAEDSSIGLALLKKRFPKIKCISRVHGWDVYFEVTQFGYLPFRTFIGDQLDAIFPISDAGKAYCIDKWKINDPKKISVARLGVKEQFTSFPRDKFTLISCSNLIPLKRVELIVDALSLIPHELEMNWYHFGDGPEMKRVKARAEEVMKNNVHYHFLGMRSNTEVLEWYKENVPDLFINVSTTEGVPVSIMEAMSFGTPVIATDVGGNSEIVNDTNGKLVPKNISAKELSEVLMYFIDMGDDKAKEYREEAFRTWKEKYNCEKNYASFTKDILSL